MEQPEAIDKLRNFSPTGDEAADVAVLHGLIEPLRYRQPAIEVRQQLIGIFERFPAASFGSPGPIVHALEASPIDEHVDLLVESLRRRATVMTVWMAERCFRSNLSDHNRQALLNVLREAAETPLNEEIATLIDNALTEYGAS